MSGGDSIPIIPCTPFSDAVPQVAKKPEEGDWNKRPTSEQVVLSEEQRWRNRAAAADGAVSLLRQSLNDVGNVVGTNYFGNGCAEGTTLFNRLGKSLADDGWKKTLKDQIASLEAVSENCRNAADIISEADHGNAKDMPK